MKKYIYILVAAFLLSGCSKVLDEKPQGVVSSEDLNTPQNAEKMVIAAYAGLGNDAFTAPYSSMWAYGSVRSGDAYKGGDGPGDVGDFNAYETFNLNRVDIGATDVTWFRLYLAIGRVNDALNRVNSFSPAEFPAKEIRQGELRFLRGHFYFLLKILFKRIPYMDETVPKTDYDKISNRDLTDEQVWDKIVADFRFAGDNLPVNQADKGRASKFSAKSYLAKVLLYQAYVQDDQNNVTSINAAKLNEVVTLTDEITNAGKYSLNGDFANNFLSAFQNGNESVFAIQYSKDDGTADGRLDNGHSLNYPMNVEYGCCGFHNPSQNLVNAYKTDGSGLPLFSTFNDVNTAAGNDFATNSFDPRLDHSVAIPGHPYKYRPSFVFQVSWTRAPQIYGRFMSLKETVLPDDPAFKKFPPFMSSSKNWDIIRYADVILFRAEALIELGRFNEALPLINSIRARAGNSLSLLKQTNGNPTSNYKITTYQPGVNCTWTAAFAREALRYERRMEFAMEGYRFFDLVRWGIAAEYLNAYFNVEKNRASHLRDALFKKNRDEYLPIPLNQINFSKGLYKQNFGW